MLPWRARPAPAPSNDRAKLSEKNDKRRRPGTGRHQDKLGGHCHQIDRQPGSGRQRYQKERADDGPRKPNEKADPLLGRPGHDGDGKSTERPDGDTVDRNELERRVDQTRGRPGKKT